MKDSDPELSLFLICLFQNTWSIIAIWVDDLGSRCVCENLVFMGTEYKMYWYLAFLIIFILYVK